MKKIIVLSILVFGVTAIQAQTEQDSIMKANQQLQMQNDSLKNLQQPAAPPAVPAAAVAPAATEPTSGKKDTRPFMKRLSVDVTTSFWVNSDGTYFEFTPTVSYNFPKTFSIGTGPTYIYRHDKNIDENLHGWGGKVFTKANFTRWLYGYTEYQLINNEYITNYDSVNKKFNTEHDLVDSWFLSLGINLRMGKRRGINAQVLYDVLYKESTSPYYSAVIYRIGFGF